MDLRPALCQQYHAALYMLRDCVQQCSDRLWTEGEYPDQFWRSAFHVTFFTQYYLSQTQKEYTPWPRRPPGFLEGMWAATDFENRGELPKDQPYLSKQQMIDFIDFVDSIVDSTIERMDLDAPDSGFDGYPEFPKLPHVLMNLGHVYYHVGQLVQLLLKEGINVDWNAHVRLEDYGQQTSLWSLRQPSFGESLPMQLRPALSQQFRSSFHRLRYCVEKCPDSLWTEGEHPRQFWRVALHAAFFTQLYILQSYSDYAPWPGRPSGLLEEMWADPAHVEPYELPQDSPILSKEQVLHYIDYVESLIDPAMSRLDLAAAESGFEWYPGFPKLPHVLMTLGHVYYHVGQLEQTLSEGGIEIKWNVCEGG